MLLDALLATARSIFPSPLKSRATTEVGFEPTLKSVGEPNAPLPSPSKIETVTELPLATVSWLGRTWPIAGGGYFRMLPKFLLRAGLRRLSHEEHTAVTYLHPCEFDPKRLEIFETIRPTDLIAFCRTALFGFHQNLGRKSIPAKMRALLASFRFSSCAEFLEGAVLSERRELLPATR